MQNTSIIETIINNPDQYQSIIEKASYSELQLIFEAYKRSHTKENPSQILQSFDEVSLREKLLSYSVSTVVGLLKKSLEEGLL